MTDIAERLEELRAAGLYRRLRLVSGPQGPRVLLDGREVLLLCSNNYLGLADHPSVRQRGRGGGDALGHRRRRVAARVGQHDPAQAARGAARRLPRHRVGAAVRIRLPGEHGHGRGALSRAGEVVFSDELNHASIIDGCRLSRAETFVYHHRDYDHLAWGLKRAEGRGSLIATDGLFSMDGDVAPLAALVELARRHDCRLLVDDAHAVGTIGPDGRGAVAEAGLEDEVDVVVGTLGKALGSYGAYVCARREITELLVNASRPFIFSTAPPPPSVAAAIAALKLIVARPERADRLRRNGDLLRRELAADRARHRRIADPDHPADRRRRRGRRWRSASGRSSAASSPRRSARRRCPRARRACG